MDAPSKESLLASIGTGTELTEDLVKKIYGYEISYPRFEEQAIAALEAAGHPKARQCYDDWVKAYESARDAELREVARWYREECDKQWNSKVERMWEQRKQEETELLERKRLLLMQKLQNSTSR